MRQEVWLDRLDRVGARIAELGAALKENRGDLSWQESEMDSIKVELTKIRRYAKRSSSAAQETVA